MLVGIALNQFSEKVHIFGVNVNGGNGETFQEGETFFKTFMQKKAENTQKMHLRFGWNVWKVYFQQKSTDVSSARYLNNLQQTDYKLFLFIRSWFDLQHF